MVFRAMKATTIFTITAAAGMISGGLVASDSTASKAAPTAGATMTYIVNVADNSAAKADGTAGTFVNVSDPEAAALAQYGSRLIERIGGMLVTEINRELAANEVSDAIDVMHLRSLELPKPKPGEPVVTAIKRTSTMLRDQSNAPDAADQAALDRIHVQIMNNEAPDKVIVQKIEHKDQPTEWRVYRPIATTQSCLACHGDPAKFAPKVREVLEKRYPGDKAIDYQRQEYRGVLRVSLRAPEKK
jgi:hypothetical protein